MLTIESWLHWPAAQDERMFREMMSQHHRGVPTRPAKPGEQMEQQLWH